MPIFSEIEEGRAEAPIVKNEMSYQEYDKFLMESLFADTRHIFISYCYFLKENLK
jgi:hypothetical protein